MAANDGDHPTRELFGVPLPSSTGAPGTSPATGRARADSAGTTVTGPAGSWQDRFAAVSGTVQPGQSEDSPVSPGPAQDYVSDGPKPDRSGHYPRRDWQQPDRRA